MRFGTTGGVVTVLAILLLLEHRLAQWRPLVPIRVHRETRRARR